MNHAHIYCKTLAALPRETAINAIHSALLQLRAIGPRVEVDGMTYDNAPVIAELTRAMTLAGHMGFAQDNAQPDDDSSIGSFDAESEKDGSADYPYQT